MGKLQSRLQGAIESLYRIDGAPSVSDFCIGSDCLETVLGPEARKRREALVILAEDGETNVGLYIAEDVLQRAEAFMEGASDAKALIDSFCVAIEGVSHFVYLAFCNGSQDRPVSQIELELQAEIDKFLVLRLAFPLPELVDELFVHFRLDEALEPHEAERYTVASHRAKRYAKWLDRKFSDGQGEAALADARRLYRKPLAFKLDHIDRAA